MYSNEFLNEIKEANPILEVASDYAKVKKDGNVYKTNCLWPERHDDDDDSDPSMVLYPHNNTFYCFGCGAGSRDGDRNGSDIIAFIQEVEKLSFTMAVEFLADRAGIELEKSTDPQLKKKIEERENCLAQSRIYYHNLINNEEVLEYPYDRGYDDNEILKWRLGLVPDDSPLEHLRGRLAFPIWDMMGRTIGFGFRSLDNSNPKYVNSPESIIFKKRQTLYGIHYAKQHIAKKGFAYVVEGYTDVHAMHRVGLENTVGIMGTSFTEGQMNMLKRITDEVVLFLDADRPGSSRTNDHIEKLLDKGFTVKIVEPDYNNWDPFDYCKHYKDKTPEIIWSDTSLWSLWKLSKAVGKYHAKIAEVDRRFVSIFNELIDNINDKNDKRTAMIMMKSIGFDLLVGSDSNGVRNASVVERKVLQDREDKSEEQRRSSEETKETNKE